MTPSESGFTLVEIAIVLLVVAVLLGYTVALFPKQQELKKYRWTR
jgi:prepilin-type N-terminal cleavage/methylation domain-containing protein